MATLCCYYAFGMPLALLFGFKLDFGVVGFWMGFTIALTMQDIIVTCIILCSDWHYISKSSANFSKAEVSEHQFEPLLSET